MRMFRCALFCVLLVGVLAAKNLDEARDEMVERVTKLRHKRAVTNVAAGLNSAVSKFAGALGADLSSSNYKPVAVAGSSWVDSCIYGSGGGKPIPVLPTLYPWNPWPVNPINPIKFPTLTGAVSSGGSVSSALGRRVASLTKREAAKSSSQRNRDIVFVLDTSGSISMAAFERAKEGVALLTGSFCPATMGSGLDGEKQIALVLFGDKVETAIPFAESHAGVEQLNSKIIALNHRRGSATATAEALRHTRTNVLGKGASRLNDADTATHVIVITDGRCNRGCSELAKEADKLRAMGVKLFAMGIDNARACELEIITGKGSDLAYGLNDFNQFEQFAEAVRDQAAQEPNGCI